MGRLSDTISDQDRVIEQLRTDVAQKESELLAGKQQTNKLFDIIANRKDSLFVFLKELFALCTYSVATEAGDRTK